MSGDINATVLVPSLENDGYSEREDQNEHSMGINRNKSKRKDRKIIHRYSPEHNHSELQQPVQIRKPKTKKKSPSDRLHLAVWFENPDLVRTLIIDEKIFIESLNAMGQTPLFVAAYTRSHQVCMVLLNLGADPNTRCVGGYSAMHGACFSASVRIMSAMLKFGGDMTIHDVHRQTPPDWIFEQPDESRKKRALEFLESIRSYLITNMQNSYKHRSISRQSTKQDSSRRKHHKHEKMLDNKREAYSGVKLTTDNHPQNTNAQKSSSKKCISQISNNPINSHGRIKTKGQSKVPESSGSEYEYGQEYTNSNLNQNTVNRRFYQYNSLYQNNKQLTAKVDLSKSSESEFEPDRDYHISESSKFHRSMLSMKNSQQKTNRQSLDEPDLPKNVNFAAKLTNRKSKSTQELKMRANSNLRYLTRKPKEDNDIVQSAKEELNIYRRSTSDSDFLNKYLLSNNNYKYHIDRVENRSPFILPDANKEIHSSTDTLNNAFYEGLASSKYNTSIDIAFTTQPLNRSKQMNAEPRIQSCENDLYTKKNNFELFYVNKYGAGDASNAYDMPDSAPTRDSVTKLPSEYNSQIEEIRKNILRFSHEPVKSMKDVNQIAIDKELLPQKPPRTFATKISRDVDFQTKDNLPLNSLIPSTYGGGRDIKPASHFTHAVASGPKKVDIASLEGNNIKVLSNEIVQNTISKNNKYSKTNISSRKPMSGEKTYDFNENMIMNAYASAQSSIEDPICYNNMSEKPKAGTTLTMQEKHRLPYTSVLNKNIPNARQFNTVNRINENAFISAQSSLQISTDDGTKIPKNTFDNAIETIQDPKTNDRPYLKTSTPNDYRPYKDVHRNNLVSKQSNAYDAFNNGSFIAPSYLQRNVVGEKKSSKIDAVKTVEKYIDINASQTEKDFYSLGTTMTSSPRLPSSTTSAFPIFNGAGNRTSPNRDRNVQFATSSRFLNFEKEAPASTFKLNCNGRVKDTIKQIEAFSGFKDYKCDRTQQNTANYGKVQVECIEDGVTSPAKEQSNGTNNAENFNEVEFHTMLSGNISLDTPRSAPSWAFGDRTKTGVFQFKGANSGLGPMSLIESTRIANKNAFNRFVNAPLSKTNSKPMIIETLPEEGELGLFGRNIETTGISEYRPMNKFMSKGHEYANGITNAMATVDRQSDWNNISQDNWNNTQHDNINYTQQENIDYSQQLNIDYTQPEEEEAIERNNVTSFDGHTENWVTAEQQDTEWDTHNVPDTDGLEQQSNCNVWAAANDDENNWNNENVVNNNEHIDENWGAMEDKNNEWSQESQDKNNWEAQELENNNWGTDNWGCNNQNNDNWGENQQAENGNLGDNNDNAKNDWAENYGQSEPNARHVEEWNHGGYQKNDDSQENDWATSESGNINQVEELQTEMRRTALFDYDCGDPDGISFKIGDVIYVDSNQPSQDGWIYGTVDNKIGWIPENYVSSEVQSTGADKWGDTEKQNDEWNNNGSNNEWNPNIQNCEWEEGKEQKTPGDEMENHDQNADTNTFEDPAAANAWGSDFVSYTALYDYDGAEPGDIAFKAGDIITVNVNDPKEAGWLYGSIEGKTGWLPDNYVILSSKEPNAAGDGMPINSDNCIGNEFNADKAYYESSEHDQYQSANGPSQIEEFHNKVLPNTDVPENVSNIIDENIRNELVMTHATEDWNETSNQEDNSEMAKGYETVDEIPINDTQNVDVSCEDPIVSSTKMDESQMQLTTNCATTNNATEEITSISNRPNQDARPVIINN